MKSDLYSLPGANPPDGNLLIQTIFSISKMHRQLSGCALADLGLFPGQDTMLLALDDSVSLTISDLATTLAVRPSTISKMVDRLENRGYVHRYRNQDDARTTMVQVTREGADIRAQVISQHQKLEAEFTKVLTLDGSAKVRVALEVLEGILKARLSRLR